MILLKPIELLLNKAITADVESQQKLAIFKNRQLKVSLTDLKLSVVIQFHTDHIQLNTDADNNADLTIAGSSFALLAIAQHPDNLFSADIKILGDVQFAKQLQDWLDGFDFDWEAQLAKITGDTLAFPIATQLRKGIQWLRQSHDDIQRNISEYIREEIHLLPDATEVDLFLSDIDTLRSDVERLEARISRLPIQRTAKKTP